MVKSKVKIGDKNAILELEIAVLLPVKGMFSSVLASQERIQRFYWMSLFRSWLLMDDTVPAGAGIIKLIFYIRTLTK